MQRKIFKSSLYFFESKYFYITIRKLQEYANAKKDIQGSNVPSANVRTDVMERDAAILMITKIRKYGNAYVITIPLPLTASYS